MIKTYVEIVAEAQKYISTVSVEEAVQKIRSTPDILVLDVREPKEHEEDSLPNARHIPRGVIELKIAKICENENQPILTHCGGGGRASLAAKTLQDMGYTNVAAINGKYADLKAALMKAT